MNLRKKMMKGGLDNIINKKMQNFLAIIIIGYFGIKIVYSLFFNFYPEKYYYRSIDITTNDKDGFNKGKHGKSGKDESSEGINDDNEPDKKGSLVEKITLNAFVPGVWNSEITDFISLLVLTYIIFVFTNFTEKSCSDENGNLTLSFLTGYLIGLGYPAIKKTYHSMMVDQTNAIEQQSSSLTEYSSYGAFFLFIIFIIIINYKSGNNSGNKINYIIFVVTIVLLIFGLFKTRKISKTLSTVSYNYNNGESCVYNKDTDNKINRNDGIIQTSGDKLKITVPFITFIVLLLFSYEPEEISMKNLYIFMYAILLGILVSGISYYGIEYFLEKTPLKECNNFKDCAIKEMGTKKMRDILEEEEIIANKLKLPRENKKSQIKNNLNNLNNLNNERRLNNLNDLNNSNIRPLNVILIILLSILTIYLIFYYIKNNIV